MACEIACILAPYGLPNVTVRLAGALRQGADKAFRFTDVIRSRMGIRDQVPR